MTEQDQFLSFDLTLELGLYMQIGMVVVEIHIENGKFFSLNAFDFRVFQRIRGLLSSHATLKDCSSN